MPHTCRGGNRRSSIPDGSPIPSCSLVGNTGVCSYRKDSLFPCNRRFVFFAAVRQSGQECRHQQDPDDPDLRVLSSRKRTGTAGDKGERGEKMGSLV